MKCSVCQQVEQFECVGFTRHSHFVEAEKLLQRLKEDRSLSYEGLYVFNCNECQSKWDISPPDNAYRGALKRISVREGRIEQLRNKYKT